MRTRRFLENSLALSHPGLAIVIGANSIRISRQMAGIGDSEGYWDTLRCHQPTLVYGVGDLLLNNMASAMRRFPVFPVFGNGDYPVLPVYAEDVAALAVDAGSRGDSFVFDAAGLETLTAFGYAVH